MNQHDVNQLIELKIYIQRRRNADVNDLSNQTRTRTREAGRNVEVNSFTLPRASRPVFESGGPFHNGPLPSAGMGWVAPVNGVILGHPFVGLALDWTQRSIMRREWCQTMSRVTYLSQTHVPLLVKLCAACVPWPC